MQKKTAVLLVNLGTPDSPLPKDVRRYLLEFLTDGRVIDIPWLWRQLLVRGFIVPRRYRESAKNYSEIWTDEGSPLLVYGNRVKILLQEALGSDYHVALAMRYQNPSIQDVLTKLEAYPRLIVLPLFPQYASATTGSVLQKVMELLRNKQVIPETRFIQSFPVHNKMIDAFCDRANAFDLKSYDHVLFSFHGLPERHLKKADRQHYCLRKKDCCKTLCHQNQQCYSAQCHATAYAMARSLELKPEDYSITYQSRLGRDPWVKPYTSDVLMEQLKKGRKRLLVFCPAFVCDCIETIHEIAVEYREDFLQAGGETLDLVPGLNDHPLWIEALKELVLEKNETKQNEQKTQQALMGEKEYVH